MRFHANHVSSSISGDYYQAMFEAEEDTNDPDSPYLLIQRQFETSDGGRCNIETHDEKYIGHFLLRRVEFTPERLSIEFDRPSDNLVSVTFSMAVTDFEDKARNPTNERSGRLLSRLGFTIEGYARNYLNLNGQWCDHIMTSLTNPNWNPDWKPAQI